jgi:SAM-dependent methyltransferase
MRQDAVDLQAFYETRQGQLVRRLIAREIRRLWPWQGGLRLLAIGYPLPYLAGVAEGAERVVALMPSGQGMPAAPRGRGARLVLAREDELPLADRSVDRVLLVHAVEASEQVRRLLREVWRVLADGGRVLAVVPNRRGLWSLSDRTPFGHGRPYSPSQLDRLLQDNLFQPEASGRALYLPPSPARFWLRTAFAWERLGLRVAPHFAGVLLVEAEKRIHAPGLPDLAPAMRRRRYVPVPAGLARSARPQGRRAPASARHGVPTGRETG